MIGLFANTGERTKHLACWATNTALALSAGQHARMYCIETTPDALAAVSGTLAHLCTLLRDLLAFLRFRARPFFAYACSHFGTQRLQSLQLLAAAWVRKQLVQEKVRIAKLGVPGKRERKEMQFDIPLQELEKTGTSNVIHTYYDHAKCQQLQVGDSCECSKRWQSTRAKRL